MRIFSDFLIFWNLKKPPYISPYELACAMHEDCENEILAASLIMEEAVARVAMLKDREKRLAEAKNTLAPPLNLRWDITSDAPILTQPPGAV